MELENTLLSHANIRETAFVALSDEKWGERPLAVIVPHGRDEDISLQEVRRHLAPKFPSFWLPDAMALVSEIPKTSVGKFDKKVIRQQILKGELEIVRE